MFDGEAFQADFAKQSHEVTEEINKWISEKTSGNIAKFFKEDLDEYTKLVLISIITFKFNWKDQFVQGSETVCSKQATPSNRSNYLNMP